MIKEKHCVICAALQSFEHMNSRYHPESADNEKHSDIDKLSEYALVYYTRINGL